MNYAFFRVKTAVLLLGLSALMMSCGNKNHHSKELKQAHDLHQQAVEIRGQVSEAVNLLKSNADSVALESICSLEQLLLAWDEQLVEVPGFEEEHEHGPNCNHDHGYEQELTPEQHLEIQQHLLQEITSIAEGIDKIKTSD